MGQPHHERWFLTDGLAGSLDGEFYRQDKLTVVAGQLPPASSTSEVVLTPTMADAFHLTVGDRMTWQFYGAALVDGLPIGALPSIGTQQTDHVSLGRGVLMDDRTLLAALDLPQHPSAEITGSGDSISGYPSTVAIDVRSPADAHALADRIASANPDGTQNGTYRLRPQLGAPVVNASQMGSLPVALAAGVAAAAVLALALTVLASVRARRRDLALLKALGAGTGARCRGADRGREPARGHPGARGGADTGCGDAPR